MNKIVKISALIGITASSIAMADNNRLLSSANTPIPPSPLYTSPEYNRGGNPIADPSFEGGTPNASWTEASTNFGTPICDEGSCGTGGAAAGPVTGSFWVWFGGIAANEAGSVSQNVTIPNGATDLTFMLNLPVCDFSSADFMAVEVDGTEVFNILGDDASCGTDAYVMQTADISAFGDGGSHLIELKSEIFGNNGAGTNFFVDDVAVEEPVPVELMNYSVE